MRKIMTLAGLALVSYALLVAAVFLFQRKLQYFPSPDYITPVEAGLKNVDEVVLTTPDLEKLVAWHTPASADMPTVLYFHGNGAGLIERGERMAKYQARGFGFFIAAYRSYAGSSGSPSERALISDARLAYEFLLKTGVRPENIVLFGESLGTGVAIQLAATVKVGAVILESPFTSAVDVGSLKYPFLPVRYLLKDQYRSSQFIGKVKAPVMVVHGGLDQVIPSDMGKKLFELANKPKEFLFLPQGGHSNLDQFGLVAKVQEFVSKYVTGKNLF